MRIKDIPWWNQPYNKLKRKGQEQLNEAELLAIILEKGSKFNESSIDLANRLLNKHKSLYGLSYLSLTELKNELKDEVKAMFELFKETNKLSKKGHKRIIESAKDVYNMFVDELSHEKTA